MTATDTATATATDLVLSTRARGPAEVAQLVEPLLPRLGITRVAEVTGLDVVGIPVWHSVRPTAAPGLNTVTSGKGVTDATARLSATMEAVERWCGEPHGRPEVVASYADLSRRAPTLDPRRLVPRRSHRWTPDEPLTWWPMQALGRDVEVYVPAVAVFTPFPSECGLLRSNTIGLAAGNEPEEALLHALYEVVEHDATTFGELCNVGHRIRPETLPAPARELVDRFERAAVAVEIHTYASGVGIPTVFAITEDTHAGDAMLFNGGAGCHLDPTTAVMRAITEAAQSRLAVIGGSREDMGAQDYRRHSSYDELRGRLRAWSVARPWADFDDLPDRSTGDVHRDLDEVRRALAADGLGLVLHTELATPDLPFSVQQVVVPGAEFAHLDGERLGVRLRRAAS